MSALWQVWTEGASRDDAAVIRAQLPRAAANAFAEVHVLGRDKDTCGGFEVFVSQEGSQDVRTRERMFSGLTQSERDEALLARTSRDDALRRPGTGEPETRRREAAGE